MTASNLCGSISYSVIVRILEDELEYDWMVYRRSKQIGKYRVAHKDPVRAILTTLSIEFRNK